MVGQPPIPSPAFAAEDEGRRGLVDPPFPNAILIPCRQNRLSTQARQKAL